MTAAVYFGLPVLLLVLGVPIFAILLMVSLAGLAMNAELPLHSVQTVVFGSLDSFPLLAIPLFILAGDIMGTGGLARRLINWVMSIVGGIRGSLGLTVVGSSTLFGAMSGSSVGCIAAVGRTLYKPLNDAGYGAKFSGGVIAGTGAIDILIPPSIPMIIYGIAAQQSVPKLFIAGIVPGLLMAVVAAVYVLWYARRNRIPMTEKPTMAKVVVSTKEAMWSLAAPVFIIGGIYGGIFTPTEAAGVAVVYAALVSRYIYREMSWKDLWATTCRSMFLMTQILIIVAAAGLYSWLVTTTGIPQMLVKFLTDLQLPPWQLLLLFNILLLVVGSFVEPPAAILILAPLFLPAVTALGIDPIHFGIIMTMNLAIGMFTPPFGLNIFAVNGLFKVPLPTLYRGVLPLLVLYIGVLMLVTYVPQISLAALKLMG
ncbi:TRAP transporter large permease [Ramlibacter sp.]|uniref:TRAP transporter large permease n=1 Tax=Ramlibacter sp. TaxID=1917967 RepID=UPI003D09B7BE